MKRSVRNLTSLMISALIVQAAATSAPAATWKVTSPGGYGTGTLREAVALAQAGDTIVFDVSPKRATIDIQANAPLLYGYPYYEQILIDKSLIIQGPGLRNLTISGGNITRLFEVAAGAEVLISGLTISNGRGRANYYTGGVAWSADTWDGYGGAILNRGSLEVRDCTVSNNLADSNWINGAGGIENANGTLSIVGCTISGNSSSGPGGVENGSGTMMIQSSTISNNTSSRGGGGVGTFSGVTILSGCTISGNDAYEGGGILNAGDMTLDTCQVTHNQADYAGGGIFNSYLGALHLIGTSVSSNKAPSGADLYNAGVYDADQASRINKIGP